MSSHIAINILRLLKKSIDTAIEHARSMGRANRHPPVVTANQRQMAVKMFSWGILDVFENEPNPAKELLSHPKIACTPHIGAATLEAQDRIGEELAQLIIGQFAKA